MRRPDFVSVLLDRYPSRNWNLAVFSLGCLFVLSLLVASYSQITASLEAQGRLRAQAERMERLDSLLIQISDAESSVRGYLLSRDRAYLKPYDASRRTIDATLEQIREDLERDASNGDLIAELNGLVALKMKVLAQSVQFGNVGDEAPPGKNADGRQYMDRIRDALKAAKLREFSNGELAIEASMANVNHTRWVVTVLSGGTLLLVMALYFLLDYQLMLRERIAQLLHTENQRLESLVQERTDDLSQLASHLTNTREAEQASLARELHDELGALMTAAKMDANAMTRHLEPAASHTVKDYLARLHDALDRGIALKRRLIDGLRPPLLSELGLVAALEALGRDFSRRSGARLQLDLPEDHVALRPEVSLALFRIAQEGLTNIQRYAAARTVRLALRLKGGHIWLELEDDGVGFDPAQVSRHRHGLAGMKHRVQMFAGDFVLVSRPGNGTRISASIPLLPAMPAKRLYQATDIRQPH